MGIGGERFTVSGALRDRASVHTLILVFIHQSIVASAAFFLTWLIANFQSGHPYQTDLLLYFAAMTLPFIPGCLSLVTLKKWENQLHRRYIQLADAAIVDRIQLHGDRASEESFTGLVSRNSFGIIHAFCEYVHAFLTFFLNSVLSIMVIAALLPGELVLGYVASAILSGIVVMIFAPVIARKAVSTESLNVTYGSTLSRMWINLSLGNPLNKQFWRAAAHRSAEQYYDAAQDLAWMRQTSNLLLGLVALAPTMFLVYQVVNAADVSAAVVAAIIVNLTRIMHILNSFGALIYQSLDLKNVMSRLGLLTHQLASTQAALTLPLSAPRGEIFMNGAPLADFAATAQILARANHGRFTITGSNGSGKSSLLIYLKKWFGDHSFLLPAHIDGLQFGEHAPEGSTGERMIHALQQVLQRSCAKVLLIDEWDANLDRGNAHALDEALSTMARAVIVVEVRH